MRVGCDWNRRDSFIADVNGFKMHLDDAKLFGDESGSTTKQIGLAALCGTAGMNAVSLLKAINQAPEKFQIDADAVISSNDLSCIEKISLKYTIHRTCDPSKVGQAVKASQILYFAKKNIVSHGTAISYKVSLNGKEISRGICDAQPGASSMYPEEL